MDKFKLISSDDSMSIWQIVKDDLTNITLVYYKRADIMQIQEMHFILNEGATLETMTAARKDLQHSAIYGHWQSRIPTITKEMVDFMHQVYKADDV